MARPEGRRGTLLNPSGRFERLSLEPEPGDDDLPVATQYFRDRSRSLITRNESPDIPFTFSVNPYRGCEHGCIYCYARPYHEYLGLSAGLDFETKIFVKEEAPAILRRELSRRAWTGEPLSLCGVTDPYQPVERRLELTRRCLTVMAAFGQPVGLITKGALVTRDADLLAGLARHDASHVWVTIPTLDETLRRSLEPRAGTADVRFDAVARLAGQGVPAGVMIAPVIPGLTDHEIPALLARARDAGASFVSYQVLRLPGRVGELFDEWLARHAPGRRAKVLGQVRQLHDGCLGGSSFGTRFQGEGPVADLVGQLFRRTRERLGLPGAPPPLSSSAFRRPGARLPLFDPPEP